MKGSFCVVFIFHFRLWHFFHIRLIVSHDSWGVSFSLWVSCRSCHIALWNLARAKKVRHDCNCLDKYLIQEGLLEAERQGRKSSFCLVFCFVYHFCSEDLFSICHCILDRGDRIIEVPLSPVPGWYLKLYHYQEINLFVKIMSPKHKTSNIQNFSVIVAKCFLLNETTINKFSLGEEAWMGF